MNLDVLMDFYRNDSRNSLIADGALSATPSHFHLSGLQGSASQFVFSAVYANENLKQFNHLIILRDAEEAAYFQNSLENLTKALDIFYFPSSFKNKKNYRLLKRRNVMLRTEALKRIMEGGNKKVMVN